MAPFDKFDGQGRATAGVDKSGQHFVISYDGSGDATWKFDNGDVSVYGADGKPVREVVGGTTFDQFDGQGRATAGVDKSGQHFVKTGRASGGERGKISKGAVSLKRKDGKPVREVGGGTTFDQFDGQGRAMAGVDRSGKNFVISYGGSGYATWKFDNGDVSVYGADGKPVREVVGGTTFDQFDGQGRATAGVDKSGQHFV